MNIPISRRLSIIGIALAVIVLLSALYIHASGNTAINNIKFEVGSEGKWKISFENVPNLAGVLTQFKGGGISNIYTTIWNTSINQGGSRTTVKFDPLSDNPAGKTFHFRVRVTQCDANGNCAVMAWACNTTPGVTACTKDGWARVSHTF